MVPCLLFSLALLAGCGGNAPAVEDVQETPLTAAEDSAVLGASAPAPAVAPLIRNPWNGLPAESHVTELTPRVFTLEANAVAESLASAEIVFLGLYSEAGGPTAVVVERQGDAEIGPLRSAGMFDVRVASVVGGVLTAADASEPVREALFDAGVETLLVSGAEGSQSGALGSRPGRDRMGAGGGVLPVWGYSLEPSGQSPEPGGQSVDSAGPDGGPPGSIRFESPDTTEVAAFRREPLLGAWVRDQTATEPLPIANLVWLEVSGSPDDPDFLIGEGLARYGGAFEEGLWLRTDSRSPLRLIGSDGMLVDLTPGSTWIIVGGRETAIEISGISTD